MKWAAKDFKRQKRWGPSWSCYEKHRKIGAKVKSDTVELTEAVRGEDEVSTCAEAENEVQMERLESEKKKQGETHEGQKVPAKKTSLLF